MEVTDTADRSRRCAVAWGASLLKIARSALACPQGRAGGLLRGDRLVARFLSSLARSRSSWRRSEPRLDCASSMLASASNACSMVSPSRKELRNELQQAARIARRPTGPATDALQFRAQ